MQLPYSEELNIEYLGRLFDSTSECYKFFWFDALITKVIDGKNEIDYEEMVDEMIAEAWYMVTEYHLNLGPRDTLEGLIDLIKAKNPQLKSCEKKSTILEFLKNTDDSEIISKKKNFNTECSVSSAGTFYGKYKGKNMGYRRK